MPPPEGPPVTDSDPSHYLGEDPPTGGGCTYTNGFWKNHPEDWPVEQLTLGGVDYTKAEAIDLLETPTKGDATIILAHQLIAAKLNVANAADDAAVSAAIDLADTWLDGHPVGSDPGKADRKTALSFMDELGNYNSGECGDDDDSAGDTSAPETGKYGTTDYDKAAAIESMSLGSLKALYR